MKLQPWQKEEKCARAALENTLKNFKRTIAEKLSKDQKHEINQFIWDHLDELNDVLINCASVEYVNLSGFEKVMLDPPFNQFVDMYVRHTINGGWTGDEWSGDVAFVIDNHVWMFHFYS